MFGLSRIFRPFSQSKIFLTAHGKDRIGIVKDICKIILDSGGNILDSQMSRMSVFFSVIMILDVPEHNQKELLDKFQNHFLLNDLQVSAKLIPRNLSSTVPSKQHQIHEFKIEGADHPGIVHTFTDYISSQGMNIESCQSFTDSAPFGSATLFRLQGKMLIPEIIDMEKFKKKLEDLEKEVGITIKID